MALILIGLAGVLLFESSKLTFGSMRVPQTAFFPSVLSVLLLLFSLLLLGQALRQPETGRGLEKIPPEGWFRIGAILATLIGFASVLERIGYSLSTFVLMILLLQAIKAQKWTTVLAVALLTSLVSYFIFGWLLNIPLPTGIFGI